MYRDLAGGRTIVCSRCGIHVEPAEVAISKRGELVCEPCAAIERLASRSRGGGKSATYASFGAFVAGLVPLALLVLPSHDLSRYKPLLSFAGMLAAILASVAVSKLTHAEDRRALGRLLPWTLAAATTGGLLGFLGVAASGMLPAGLCVLGLLIWRASRNFVRRRGS